MLFNKIDLQMVQWRNEAKLDQLVFKNEPYTYFFTTLNPLGEALDRMLFREKQQFYERLPKLQQDFLMQLGAKFTNQEKFEAHFASSRLRTVMTEHLWRFFRDRIPAIERSLAVSLAHVDEAISAARAQSLLVSEPDVKKQIALLGRSFVDKMIRISNNLDFGSPLSGLATHLPRS